MYMAAKELVFYYDVICPYAYVASRYVAALAKRTEARLIWRPVLLGGIYKEAVPAQNRDDSNRVITKINMAKRSALRDTLNLLLSQRGMPSLSLEKIPGVKSLSAMRLLAAVPDECGEDIENLTHSLYDSLWLKELDISDVSVLQQVASQVGLSLDVQSIIPSNPVKERLISNTKEAVARGAFGVPSFWTNDRLFFGVDRMHLVERALGNKLAEPFRVMHRAVEGIRRRKLTYFFDFSSPYSYLGFKSLPQLLRSVAPVQVDVEYVPILIGVLFKAIGSTYSVQNEGENKIRFAYQDLVDWQQFHGVKTLTYSSYFPLRTILPARAVIVQPTYDLIEAIYDATWADDKNTGDEKVLREVLNQAGFNGDELISKTRDQGVKDQLRRNTQRAIDAGLCGLPSYQIDDGRIIWGQDKQNFVADLLLGWSAGCSATITSKL